MLAAPRGLSQLATSFIADTCLGIHHCALTYLTRIPPESSNAEALDNSDVNGKFNPLFQSLHQKPSQLNFYRFGTWTGQK